MMYRCLWIGICMFMQIQGAWLIHQYPLYATPYLKVVCEKEMEFQDTEIDSVKRVDVWKEVQGIRLHVPNPMKPEYHIYTDAYPSVVNRLMNDHNIISVSYRRYTYRSYLTKRIFLYILEWIGVVLILSASIRYRIPENKKILFQMMGFSIPVLIKKCGMGFVSSGLLAFGVVLLMIRGKIIDSVPILFCGMIGLVFVQMGILLEIIYLHR